MKILDIDVKLVTLKIVNIGNSLIILVKVD